MDDISTFVRDVADFPEPGVTFKDITPLLADADAFARAVDAMARPFDGRPVDVVAGMEARGFLFGPVVAQHLGVGFVPMRKPGKLPSATHSVSYDLEYGSDALEVHIDGIESGMSVLIVDDVLATGGTLAAAIALIELSGAKTTGASLLIELVFLGGRGRLRGVETHALMEVS
jgi:adenine phosphoribosyltransferase